MLTDAPERSRSGESVRWVLLAVIAVIAVAQVAVPFTGDQALFTVFGRQLNQGDALYVDLWDVKQPLLFWWYAGAGALAGYAEVGVHLVEAAYLVGFAAVLPWLLRGQLRSREAEILAPVLSVGMYFLTAEVIDLTQAEVLAGPVVFLAVWLGALATPADRRRLVAAGVLVGIAGAVKITFVPVAAVGLLVALLADDGGRTGRLRRAVQLVAWALSGFALAVAALLLYLGVTGATGEALDTWFRFAPSTTATGGRTFERLLRTIGRFVLMYAPVLLLAALSMARLRRTSVREHRLRVAMVLWLVVAVPAFLIQHWWAYLLQIMVLPLGVLAADGLALVLRGPLRGRRWVLALLVAASAVTLVVAAPKWITVAEHRFGVTPDDRVALQAELSPAHVRGRDFRDSVTVDGPAFVLADPVLLYVSGRDLGIPTNGWLPEQLDDAHWARVGEELADYRPPVVVVDEAAASILDDRAEEVRDAIDEGWCEVGGNGPDTWYLRRDLGRCP